MKYEEALAWLYATQRFGIKLGLENIERLLRALNLDVASLSPGSARASRAVSGAPPETSFHPRVIHVAGTNGKGSVCAMIDSIARKAGYRSGLFTSPHLVSFRERIRVNGGMISENEVALRLREMRQLLHNWDPHPTFFEIVTALALKHFQSARCDLIVLETGLGGRLDATNAVQSSISVITPIDFDHEKWLGHSIAEIASEKAGIIKPNTPIISAAQSQEAKSVIENRARECGSPLRFIDEQWISSTISLIGRHQQSNAAVAVAAVKTLDPGVLETAVERGLASVEWPGRFQIFDDRIVIDGAHNPAGAKLLAQTWREKFPGERATVILAILRDKNARAIVEHLVPIAQRILLPLIQSERALRPEELAREIPPPILNSTSPTIADAISTARNYPERILICGSLHFAGEALAVLQGEPAAFEECAQ